MYNVVCISRQFAWQFYCLVFLLLGSFIAWQFDCMVPYCLMVILPQEIWLFTNELAPELYLCFLKFERIFWILSNMHLIFWVFRIQDATFFSRQRKIDFSKCRMRFSPIHASPKLIFTPAGCIFMQTRDALGGLSHKKEPAQWASSSSMPAAGVEPALPLGERDFKSRASANSAMPAGTICNPPKHGLFCCVNSSIKLPLLHHFWCSGPSGTRTQDRPVMSREL